MRVKLIMEFITEFLIQIFSGGNIKTFSHKNLKVSCLNQMIRDRKDFSIIYEKQSIQIYCKVAATAYIRQLSKHLPDILQNIYNISNRHVAKYLQNSWRITEEIAI